MELQNFTFFIVFWGMDDDHHHHHDNFTNQFAKKVSGIESKSTRHMKGLVKARGLGYVRNSENNLLIG